MPNLFKNASWGGVSAAIRLIFGMASLFLGIKLAGASAYGYLALTLSISTFYVTLINSVHTISVTYAADIRVNPKSDCNLDMLFSAVWLLTLISIFIICIAVYFFGHEFLRAFVYSGTNLELKSNLYELLLVVLVITVFQIISAGNVAVIESLGRFDLAARGQLFGPIINFFLLAYGNIQYKNLSVSLVAEVLALGAAVDSIVILFIRLKMGYLSAFFINLKVISLFPRLFSHGLALQGSKLINVFFDPFNKYLLNLYTGPASVTIYEVAMKIIFGIQGLFGGAFRTFLQLTSRMKIDGSADYLKSLRYGLVPALLLHGICGVFVVGISYFWMPEGTLGLPQFYLLLIPSSMGIIFIAPLYGALIGIRDLRFIFRMHLNLAILNGISSLIFIPIIGLYGAAVGLALSTTYNIFAEYRRYSQKIGKINGLHHEIKSLRAKLVFTALVSMISLSVYKLFDNKNLVLLLESSTALILIIMFLLEPLSQRIFGKVFQIKKIRD